MVIQLSKYPSGFKTNIITDNIVEFYADPDPDFRDMTWVLLSTYRFAVKETVEEITQLIERGK